MEAGLRTKKVNREINIEDEMEVKRRSKKEKMAQADGFIAALDQSGGSTPKALGLYGVSEDAWSTEEEMFDLVHAMRTRIITSPAFNGDRILAAILFENTMKNTVEGLPTAEYLWSKKQVVPIKIDKGLARIQIIVQMMKPMTDLGNTLSSANEHGIFGTKMRSVIKEHSTNGIHDVVKQQFEVGAEILSAGLVPIIEPEVDINCPDKTGAETFLKECIISSLDDLREGQEVMLKLTLPEEDGLYQACVGLIREHSEWWLYLEVIPERSPISGWQSNWEWLPVF